MSAESNFWRRLGVINNVIYDIEHGDIEAKEVDEMINKNLRVNEKGIFNNAINYLKSNWDSDKALLYFFDRALKVVFNMRQTELGMK